MRKIVIEYGRTCVLVFSANTTMIEICNTINELDFFTQAVNEIEKIGYLIDHLNLGENIISGDNGVITIIYSVETKPIIIYK